jgi:hypothetical protein
MIVNASVVLAYASIGNGKLINLLIPSAQFWDWIPFNQFIILTIFILYALVMENTGFEELCLKIYGWEMRKTGIQPAAYIYLLLDAYLITITVGFGPTDIMLLIIVCFYLTLCAGLWLRHRHRHRHRQAQVSIN